MTAGAGTSRRRNRAPTSSPSRPGLTNSRPGARNSSLRKEAGQDLTLPAREGHEFLAELKPRERKARLIVDAYAKKFAAEGDAGILLDEALAAAMEKTETRPDLTRSAVIPLLADRERARCGAWYEMVPRSQGTVPGKHGTFDDCITRLPEIAALGFDVST